MALHEMSAEKNPGFTSQERGGLLLRNPITQTYTTPNYRAKSLLYSRNVRPEMAHCHSEILEEGSTPQSGQSFYTRHNPHPVRVRHLKGLLDHPVCMVEDNLERRILWSAPSGEESGIAYRPPGSTRYSANRSKHLAAIGIVPVTYAWRDELEKKAYNAISKALGQTPIPMTQQGPRRTEKMKEFDSMDDNQLLNLLCRILQTDSIPACQAWLQAASDTEKTIVLNMLRMAASGEINHVTTPYQSRPNSSKSLYMWNHHETPEKKDYPLLPPDPSYPWNLELRSEDALFKLPQHDTVIRSAQSRLMTSEGNERQRFHERLQNELDQTETIRLQQLSRGSSRHTSSLQSRPISAGLVPGIRPPSQSRSRPRSRSAGSAASTKREQFMLSPPVKVGVSGVVRRPEVHYWSTATK